MTRTRRSPERPPVAMDVAPAYEMLMSLVTALDVSDADTYEVGPDWITEVRARAGDDLLARLEAA